MRKVVFAAILALTGCGTSAKPAATGTIAMTSKTWSVWVHNTADQNIVTAHAKLTAGACAGVAGPMCFTGSDLSNSSDDPTPVPVSLTIGVPADPVPLVSTDGYAFNFAYSYQTADGTADIAGTGRFYPNGNVTGTWQCTGVCTATTGDFTASQP